MNLYTLDNVIDRKPVLVQGQYNGSEWHLTELIDPKTKEKTGDTVWRPRVRKMDDNGRFTNQWYEPKFLPLPGSQVDFLTCPVFEAIYTGTRGNGKTITLIWDFAQEVGKGYGSAWRGVLFRRSYGDLDDVVRKIESELPKVFEGFHFLRSKADYAAVWPTGERLLLRHLMDIEGYNDFHGHEYPWIGFEELTQWEDDKPYKAMQSCCRPTMPGIPLRIRGTTNPHGAGHGWVKERFKLPEGHGRIIRNPGEMPRVAIAGHVSENFVLLHSMPDYPKVISGAAVSAAQADAWVNGNWNINTGGIIQDKWDPLVHILPPVPPRLFPRGWKLTRAYDHGQAHPFSVGWFAESNGESLEYQGRHIGTVRGDIIMFSEWYGCQGVEINTGVRLSAKKIAQGILDREEDMGIKGRVRAGPADTEIWSKDQRGTGLAPADDMEGVGVYWERADKSAGSRVRGWQMLRARLENSLGVREKPGFFVTENCKFWLKIVPPAPCDPDNPDDIPEKYPDHCCDMTRYRVNWDMPGGFRRSF